MDPEAQQSTLEEGTEPIGKVVLSLNLTTKRRGAGWGMGWCGRRREKFYFHAQDF